MPNQNHTTSTPLDIVIIGGSLTGLFAGIALKSLSQVKSITILERLRQKQLQYLGAGIRCNEEVNDAIFDLLGIRPESYAAFVDVYCSFDSTGKMISKIDTGMWTTTWGQLYRVLKGGFDGSIGNWKQEADSGKCRYRLGCSLAGLEDLRSQAVHRGEDTLDSKSDSRPGIRIHFDNENSQRESIIADLVIGADGASSKTRSLVLPQIERTVAPYLCYRGVVDPSDLSPSTTTLYQRAGIFSWPAHHTGQFISYVVPGTTDKPDESTHCISWVLYSNKSPQAMRQLMTDKDGKLHQYLLSRGKMNDEEIQKLRMEAKETLPGIHAEVVEKTKQPFVQLVTDSLATNNCFWDGRLLLVGDAVGGQRPHSASALMQGIYHGLLLRKVLQSEITLEQWSTQTRNLTQILVETGQEMGEIIMKQVLPPDEKVPLYVASFMRTQEKLNEIWRGTIGIGDAKVKL